MVLWASIHVTITATIVVMPGILMTRPIGRPTVASCPGASGTNAITRISTTAPPTLNPPNDQRQSSVVPSHEPSGVPSARPIGGPTDTTARERPANRGGLMRRA